MNKTKTIKNKITFWYTGIIIVVFLVTICGFLFISEYYSTDNIRTELMDEVGDLKEDMNNYSSYFPDNELMSYYDDGVMLSLYTNDGKYINGIVPDDFPQDYPFDEKEIHSLSKNEDYWYIYDKKIRAGEKNEYLWIRGIHSYSSVANMINNITKWFFVFSPILTLFTALIGYRMISEYFKPIKEMTDTANEITNSQDLSLRIKEIRKEDELSYLSKSFNGMISKLEEHFNIEKQFVSDAAHELRTPISVILSNSEYLLEECELEDEEKKYVTTIHKKTSHMANLVDALLVISRLEKSNYEINYDKIDFSVLVQSVMEEMEEDAKEKEITLNLMDHLGKIEYIGDMTLLIQLFTNLISNAIKYGREGGNVNISLSCDNSLIKIYIEDDGIGISKEHLNKIWNRFYQVNSSHNNDGFGLGLFIVKLIVQLHKGTIEVSSMENKGTVFIVTLPRTL